jgi:hypothetical protein
MANNDRHPNAWINDMRRVADTRLVQDLVSDFRNYSPTPRADPNAKVIPQGAGRVVTAGEEVQRGTGWTDPPKVDDWKPPGLEHMDRMMDQADREDRAQRIRELAGTQHALNLAKAAAEAERKDREAEAKEKLGNKGEPK